MAVSVAILCGVTACAGPDATRMNRGTQQQAGEPSGPETKERHDELRERGGTEDDDSTSHVWVTALRKEPMVLSGHNRAIRCVAFSADGTRLASASDDNTVRIWDTRSGEELAVLRGHEHTVSSLSFSPDALRLATGSYDTTVRVWETTTGRTLSILRGHEDLIRCVAFSPDGTRVASGSHDRTVRIWDSTTGQALTTFQGDAHTVMSVAFSPDGARLLTAGHSVAHVWDTATWKELLVLARTGRRSGQLDASALTLYYSEAQTARKPATHFLSYSQIMTRVGMLVAG